jgi:hypothetical protein
MNRQQELEKQSNAGDSKEVFLAVSARNRGDVLPSAGVCQALLAQG